MPTFNFSVVDVVKKKVPQKVKSNDAYKVIQKKVVGIVHVDIDANYYVIVDNQKYPIAAECYTCKGKCKLYRQGEYDYARYVWIRAIDFNSMNTNYWLPFTVGCVVTGDVIHSNNFDKFVITNVTDEITIKTHEAMVFYREHLKEINDKIRQRR